ncbi:Hypothetical protein GcLGCM259_2491 [Glutamicibacter creatinolyticus]|uniref:NAD-dependent epimerase/dehydratase domain-containing protein n=1 Tax=Glutamicibacter creatinolyticus TaxID=162496 RepID=A0A5B7WW14_9MICC|nr:NAD-dependent epimerase/dehydratase family protein [Glutamicibacter creatinolyticus]QCY48198.1 Hypothetical protein GcLGCM259_2491 [Glutamicibacter creatinolyticus]
MTPQGTTLVTGASGFLGSRVVRRLIDCNIKVVGVDNKPSPDASFPFFECDISNKQQVHTRLSHISADVLIHLAAIHFIPECEANPQLTYETNVIGTRNMLEYSARTGVSTFTFASSADVYQPSVFEHTEDDALSSPSVYGRSKIAAEALVREWHRLQPGRTANILRLFNLVGRDDPVDHLIPSLVKKMYNTQNIYVGNFSSQRDYVLVDDVADLMLRTTTDGEIRILNVGNGVGYSGFEVFNEVSNQIGGPHFAVVSAELTRSMDRPRLVANRGRLDLYDSAFPRRNLSEMLSLVLNDGLS